MPREERHWGLLQSQRGPLRRRSQEEEHSKQEQQVQKRSVWLEFRMRSQRWAGSLGGLGGKLGLHLGYITKLLECFIN